MIECLARLGFSGAARDNLFMRQLQLFTSAEMAKMRDRTRSRNYSPVIDEFRREHARHRAWGLERRHAEKLRRIHAGSDEPPDRLVGNRPPTVPPPELGAASPPQPRRGNDAPRPTLDGHPLTRHTGAADRPVSR